MTTREGDESESNGCSSTVEHAMREDLIQDLGADSCRRNK